MHTCEPLYILICESPSGSDLKCYNSSVIGLNICLKMGVFFTFVFVLGVNILFIGDSQFINQNLLVCFIPHHYIWLEVGHSQGGRKRSSIVILPRENGDDDDVMM